MPVFNDIGFYLTGGYNPYAAPYTPPSRSGFLSFSPPSFSIPSIFSSSGMRYRPEPMKFNSPYSGGRTAQFPSNPYMSNYATYSDWKENLLLNKIRDDKSYKWKDLGRNNIYRPNRPVFVDTSKIDVSRPKPKREVAAAESEKENKFVNEEKGFNRDNPMKGTITRGRTVVRIHTTALKENPYFAKRREKSSTIKSKQSSNKKSKQCASNIEESGSESDRDDDDDENESFTRDNTVKKRTVKKKGKDSLKSTNKEEKGLVGGLEAIVRKCKIRKRSKERRKSTDFTQGGVIESRSSLCPPAEEKRRLSMEFFEEETAILDNLIQQELDRKDADDYFSDPKRGTVKISCKQRLSKSERDARKKAERELHTESSTTDDDLDGMEGRKKITKRKSQGIRSDSESGDSSSGSRRNSLFQDLFLEATIAENTLGELEDQADLESKKPQNKKWKIQQKSVKPKKPRKLQVEPRHKAPVISAIIEVEEKPKTPKFFIDKVEVTSEVPSKFGFDFDSEDSGKKEENLSNEAIPKKQDTVIRKTEMKAKSLKKSVIDRFKKVTTPNTSKPAEESKSVEKTEAIQKSEAKKNVNSTQVSIQHKFSQAEILKNERNIEKTALNLEKDKFPESKNKPKTVLPEIQKCLVSDPKKNENEDMKEKSAICRSNHNVKNFPKVETKKDITAIDKVKEASQGVKPSQQEIISSKSKVEKIKEAPEGADSPHQEIVSSKETYHKTKGISLGVKSTQLDTVSKKPADQTTKEMPGQMKATQQQILPIEPTATKDKTFNNSRSTVSDELQGKETHQRDSMKLKPKAKVKPEFAPVAKTKPESQLSWKQQLAKKMCTQMPKDATQNKVAKINEKNFPKKKLEEALKKQEKKLEKFPLVISAVEKPEFKKPYVLSLPVPSQVKISETSEEPERSSAVEDESSMSETEEGTDSGTETEEDTESQSDDGMDKLRPSYSNDSGFGSAYHKNRKGILV